MKFVMLSFIFLVVFTSCHKQEAPKPVTLQKSSTPAIPAKSSVSSAVKDDFSDLKKEGDEHCDSEEELLKKQIEKAKQAEKKPLKLQGSGDEGCAVN